MCVGFDPSTSLATKRKYSPEIVDSVNLELHMMLEELFPNNYECDAFLDEIPNNIIQAIANKLKLRETTVKKIVDTTWNVGDDDDDWDELDVTVNDDDNKDNDITDDTDDAKYNDNTTTNTNYVSDGFFDLNLSSAELYIHYILYLIHFLCFFYRGILLNHIQTKTSSRFTCTHTRF